MKKSVLLFFIVFTAIFGLKAQLLQDGFESYNDFIITGIGNWTMIDNDGGTTYGSSTSDFPNENYVGSYIVFNSKTTDPVSDDPWAAHSGNKCLICFNSTPSTSAPNDDWIISPEFTVGSATQISLWVKTGVPDWGLERYNVYLMNGTTTADVVDTLNAGAASAGYDEAPSTWTNLVYDISGHDTETLRLAIQCVSNDFFTFMVDDIFVGDASSETLYNVTFNCDISDSISSGYFTEGTDVLYVAGNMSGAWAEPGTVGSYQLSLPTGNTDGIYSTSMLLPSGTYEYKYFKNTSWDNGEWNGGDNRSFTVAGSDTTINDVFGKINVSVNEISKEGINVFPNPSNGVFNINVENNYNLEVFDITGRVINTRTLTGNTTLELNTAGIYFLRFSNKKGSYTQKVIVR